MNPYHKIVETVPIFFFILDIRKKATVFLSKRFYHKGLKDFHQPDEQRENLRQYISPEDQAAYDTFFESLSPQNNYHGKISLKAADNLVKIQWLSLETYPMLDGSEVNCLVGHIRDITFEKESNQLLDEQVQSLDVIAFMLAHELSSPISNIMGLSDFLKEVSAEEGSHEYLHLFDTIYNFGGEILTLARGLVSLIQLQEEKINKVEKTNFALLPFLESELKEFYFRHRDIQINIEYDLSDQFQVHADQRKLKRVIDELLLYLLKVSNESADIFITVLQEQGSTVDQICIYAKELNLPKEQIRLILRQTSHLKLSDVTGKKVSGVLELLIAKEIIQLHGGELDLYESEDHEGVLITLPTQEQTEKVDA